MGQRDGAIGERVRGLSGRDYTIRCRIDEGRQQWFVGIENGAWGTPFVTRPLARQWARTH